MSRDERAAALEDLADAIRDLGSAIDDEHPDRSRTRPSMSDVLRVTDELAIPALITLLETQIRALKAMQRGSRLVRRGNRAQDRVHTSLDDARSRRPDVDAVVDQLGSTIEAIQARLGDTDEETQALLDRTRSTYEEIDRAITSRADDRSGQDDGYRIEIDDGGGDTTDRSEKTVGEPRTKSTSSAADHVDVDAELRTLKDQYGTPADPEPGDDTRDQSGHPTQPGGPAVGDESENERESRDESDSKDDDGSIQRDQTTPGRGDSAAADDRADPDDRENDSHRSDDQDAPTGNHEPDDVDQ